MVDLVSAFYFSARLLPSCRLTLGVVGCLALAFLYLLRTNFNMSLVCMVKPIYSHSNSSVNNDNSKTTSNITSVEDDVDNVKTNSDRIIDEDNIARVVEDGENVLCSNANNSNSCGLGLRRREDAGGGGGGELDWSREFQGYVLSAYYYGHVTVQMFGGWLAGRYGGKHVLSTGVLVAGIATLLTPSAARYSGYLVIVLRAVIGMATVGKYFVLV